MGTQSSFKMTIKNLIRFEQLAQMSPEERAAENQRVWDIRAECLVGRTIIGTLTSTNAKGRTFYWIKWDNAKCDTVKVPVSALEDIGNPKLGATLKCVVTGLGPELSKVKSAWCAHPMTKEVEQVDPSAVHKLLADRRNALKGSSLESRFYSLSRTRSNSPRPRFINSRTNSNSPRPGSNSSSWRRR